MDAFLAACFGFSIGVLTSELLHPKRPPCGNAAHAYAEEAWAHSRAAYVNKVTGQAILVDVAPILERMPGSRGGTMPPRHSGPPAPPPPEVPDVFKKAFE